MAFDNSSGFSNEVSDALCRVVTGGGFSTRTLYGDSEESIFNFKRPVLLNGIGDFINRPDLLERSMILELDPLEKRLTERQLQEEINNIKPDLLGFLLTSISKALPIFEALDDGDYDLPRMADFGLWLVALEKVWGLPEKLLLNTFNSNQSRSSEVALESSPVALAIFKLFDGGRSYWDGTTQELLDYFLKSDIFATLVKAKDFPKTVHALRTQLARLTPDLAKQGFEIEKTRSKISRKLIIRKLKEIEIIDKPSSPTDKQTLELIQNKAFQGDDGVTIPENTIVIGVTLSQQGLQKMGDDGDDAQGKTSISVRLKDGTLAEVGLKVKTPDGSIAEVVWIESEDFIRLEGLDHSFAVYSLETA